jgi:uncharacterized membrane protein
MAMVGISGYFYGFLAAAVAIGVVLLAVVAIWHIMRE